MSRLRSQPLPIALAISIGLGLSIALIAHATLPGWRWFHPLVHTAIEALGGLCAIVLALVLFKQDIAGHHIRFLPLAIGCLFMGILEEFHAVAEPGNGFILLRSLASLSGAVGFALAWKSNAPVRGDQSGLVPWVTAVCAVFLGTFIISFPDRLPVMAFDGAFTPTAIALTVTATVLFLISFVRFWWDSRRTESSEAALFAGLALVFGLAELMFTYSALWDVRWWCWHLLRLMGYMLVLGVMVKGYQRMLIDLKGSLAHTRDAEESARRSERHLRQVLDGRARMAQDLHDGIIQSLFAQTLNLERCQRLVRTQAEEVIGQLGYAVAELKTVIRGLRGYLGGLKPEPAEGENLEQALASQVRVMQDVSGMNVDVKIDPAAAQLVLPEQAMHMLFIAREALSNVLQHSKARQVSLRLERHSAGVRLVVEDDGIGFTAGTRQRGEGLKNMAARAATLHAEVTVSSGSGRGTHVVFELPVEVHA